MAAGRVSDLMTPDQLRDRARQYRDMAATARTQELRDAQIRIAEGFEALAATREGYWHEDIHRHTARR
jgi:hypothetical protein